MTAQVEKPQAKVEQPAIPATPPELLSRIQRSRKVAEEELRKLKRKSSFFTYCSVACSSLATLIAGFAAMLGPAIGDGPPAWRATCGVVACFTAGAGVLTGVQQNANVASDLAKVTGYTSRLTGLELGLTVIGRDVAHVAKEYEELLLQHPHLYVA